MHALVPTLRQIKAPKASSPVLASSAGAGSPSFEILNMFTFIFYVKHENDSNIMHISIKHDLLLTKQTVQCMASSLQDSLRTLYRGALKEPGCRAQNVVLWRHYASIAPMVCKGFTLKALLSLSKIQSVFQQESSKQAQNMFLFPLLTCRGSCLRRTFWMPAFDKKCL